MSRTRSVAVASYFPFHSRREMYRAKRLADRAVQDAIRRRELQRQPCERCGRKRAVEAHHDDYLQPLAVRWFCRPHHRERDAELRAEQRRSDQLMAASFSAVQAAELASMRAAGVLLGNPATLPFVRQATGALLEAMRASGATESHIARSLKCSRQMVNQQFGAGLRTLKTLAAFADVIGYDASVVLTKREPAAERAS
jgi:hypothetical protein